MKKVRFIGNIMIVLAIMTMALFVSCSDEVKQPALAKASINVQLSDPKSLTVTDQAAITEYRYKAEPLFTDQFTTGATGDFVRLGTDASDPLPIGNISPGKWRFSVRGLNSNGIIIATGTIEQYVSSEGDNIITVPIVTDRTIGKGRVTINVTSDATSDSKMGLIVRYRATNESSFNTRTTWNATYSPDKSTVTLSGAVENLDAGLYEFHFILTDNGVYIGGESHTIQIVSQSTTTVSGTILPAKEFTETLDITSPGFIQGSLGEDVQIHKEESVTFTWTNTSQATVVPDTYIWMVDGVFQQNTGKSYTYVPEDYGQHQVSVIALKIVNGKEREIGSSTVTVGVLRRLANITFDAGEGIFPNGNNTITISQNTYDNPLVPDIPVMDGYMFGGWYDGTHKVVSASNVIDTEKFKYEGDKTLTAAWTKVNYTATVIWGEDVRVNGQLTASSTTHNMTIHDTMSFLKTPTRDGYSFGGFWTETNGRGDRVTATSKYEYTKNMTFYVKWVFNNIVVSFYKDVGGQVYKTKTVAMDTPYGMLPSPMKQGYVFKGWVNNASYVNNENATRVTADTTVTNPSNHSLWATWEQGNIKVTLDPRNGGALSYGKVAMGSFYGTVIPADPVMRGFTFRGWFWEEKDLKIISESIVATDKDHTLVARWQGNDYTVSFNSNGGSTCVPITVRYGNPYGTLPAPSRSGYTFLGWKYNGTVITADTIADITDANHTLTAQWEANTIHVSFDALGGTSSLETGAVVYQQPYSTIKNLSGTTVGLGNVTASRTGYIFRGWRLSSTAESTISGSTVNTSTVDHSLYATWEAKQANLLMYRNWNDQDNTLVNDEGRKLTYGASFGMLANLERTGYNFLGYYTQRSGGTKVSDSTVYNVDSTADYKIYAQWTLKTQNITLDANGGTYTAGPNPIQKQYSTPYGNLGKPDTRTGYDFVGWFRGEEQIADSTGVSTMTMYLEEDHTLKAHWTPHSWVVYFNSNGGTSCNSQPVTFDTAYGTLPSPTKYGYTFLGWYEDTSLTTEVQSGTVVKKDYSHTLYAKWGKKPVNVTFNWGLDATVQTVEYDSPYGAFPQPDLAKGKGIEGWYTTQQYTTRVNPSTIVTDENPHTLYGKVVSVDYHYHISSADTYPVWDYNELVSCFTDKAYTAVPSTSYIGSIRNITGIRRYDHGGVIERKSGTSSTSWTQDYTQDITFTATAQVSVYSGIFTCDTCKGETKGKNTGNHSYTGYESECSRCNGTGKYTTIEEDCDDYDCNCTETCTPQSCSREPCGAPTCTTTCDTCTSCSDVEVQHSCPKYEWYKCYTCNGTGKVTKYTTTYGSTVIKVGNSTALTVSNTTNSGSATTNVASGKTITVTVNAAPAATGGYDTFVRYDQTPSFSAKDSGYNNAEFIAYRSNGETVVLDGMKSSGEYQTRFHKEQVSLGSVVNTNFAQMYFFPEFVYRDTYIDGILQTTEGNINFPVEAGGGDGRGHVRMPGFDQDVSNVVWGRTGLYATGSKLASWTIADPVAYFEMNDFYETIERPEPKEHDIYYITSFGGTVSGGTMYEVSTSAQTKNIKIIPSSGFELSSVTVTSGNATITGSGENWTLNLPANCKTDIMIETVFAQYLYVSVDPDCAQTARNERTVKIMNTTQVDGNYPYLKYKWSDESSWHNLGRSSEYYVQMTCSGSPVTKTLQVMAEPVGVAQSSVTTSASVSITKLPYPTTRVYIWTGTSGRVEVWANRGFSTPNAYVVVNGSTYQDSSDHYTFNWSGWLVSNNDTHTITAWNWLYGYIDSDKSYTDDVGTTGDLNRTNQSITSGYGW